MGGTEELVSGGQTIDAAITLEELQAFLREAQPIGGRALLSRQDWSLQSP